MPLWSRSYQLVVLGDSGVGKTALLEQLCHKQFVATYSPSTKVLMTRTQISIDDQPYPLEVLDTAGTLDLEHDRCLEDWIRNSIGVVLVYDATSRKSYDRIRYLLQRVYEIKGTPDFLPIMIIGNKSDKEISRVVSPEEGAELAGKIGCMFANTSAMNFEDVLDPFYRVVEVLVGSESPRGYAWMPLLGGDSDNGCCRIM